MCSVLTHPSSIYIPALHSFIRACLAVLARVRSRGLQVTVPRAIPTYFTYWGFFSYTPVAVRISQTKNLDC